MTEIKKSLELDEDHLEEVSGGTDISYGMDNDPLYLKFNSFWQSNKDRTGGSGMDSRAEFMEAFRQWISDGVPQNISAWYRSYTEKNM